MATQKERLSADLAKFVEQREWAKAVKCLQGLVELEPSNANYYLRMGDYSVKAGKKSDAVKAYYQAAKLFVDSGFSVKGIATYKMILRLDPAEKQAKELMRVINASPAVSGGLGPPLLFTPEAPPPPPLTQDEPPAPAGHDGHQGDLGGRHRRVRQDVHSGGVRGLRGEVLVTPSPQDPAQAVEEAAPGHVVRVRQRHQLPDGGPPRLGSARLLRRGHSGA